MLRELPRAAGGRAIDLGRVLARERAAAVPGGAAVGVDDGVADLVADLVGVAVCDRLGRREPVHGPAAVRGRCGHEKPFFGWHRGGPTRNLAEPWPRRSLPRASGEPRKTDGMIVFRGPMEKSAERLVQSFAPLSDDALVSLPAVAA
ncbi:hypothetical protein U1T56_13480 [Geminicoccaceae bacterium SYSU G07066]|uniref:Uncharacterized protein n=1 Tax=Benzoatithermus flavus TaxID=3108223 RepID=A0ABU8XSI7_9PROT